MGLGLIALARGAKSLGWLVLCLFDQPDGSMDGYKSTTTPRPYDLEVVEQNMGTCDNCKADLRWMGAWYCTNKFCKFYIILVR